MPITVSDTEIAEADFPAYLSATAADAPWLLDPDSWEPADWTAINDE
jgi:hypothetical protein